MPRKHILYSNCLPYINFFPEMCSQILKKFFGKFQTCGNVARGVYSLPSFSSSSHFLHLLHLLHKCVITVFIDLFESKLQNHNPLSLHISVFISYETGSLSYMVFNEIDIFEACLSNIL